MSSMNVFGKRIEYKELDEGLKKMASIARKKGIGENDIKKVQDFIIKAKKDLDEEA